MVSFKYPETAFIEKNLQTLMPFLIPIAAKISIALTLVIALFSSGLYVGNRLGISSCQEAVIDSQAHSIETGIKQAVVSDQTVTKYVDRVQIVQGKSREIIKEVIHVQDTCTLSAGWRLLHDSAANNELPDTSRDSDERTVTSQDALERVAANYGICHENSTTLSSLQEWVKEQSLVR
jgi:hypothetical protein